MQKVLFARVDRIGDLILTLPSEQAWKSALPQCQVFWLVDEKLEFVFVEKAHLIFAGKWRNFWGLVKKLKQSKFDACICFHVPWWIVLAVFFAGIKKRVGVASQWYSFLFFNFKLRQKRSQALKNEAQYNLDLVNFALGKKIEALVPYKLSANQDLSAKWGAQLGNNYVVIHAGMGGSARNWPPENYKNLAEELIAKGIKVVVTGSTLDESFVKSAGLMDLKGAVNLVAMTTSQDLLAVLSLAKAVVAPSTGVAHLAAALGVKVLGIYSPVKVQSPTRWAPIGPQVQVFVPQVTCPGVFECLGAKCAEFDCMKKIEVKTLVSSI